MVSLDEKSFQLIYRKERGLLLHRFLFYFINLEEVAREGWGGGEVGGRLGGVEGGEWMEGGLMEWGDMVIAYDNRIVK